MRKPPYCTQPSVPDCWHCSLANYGYDCANRSIAAREFAALGGRTKSAKRAAASRRNGRKGGRPSAADLARRAREEQAPPPDTQA